MTESTYLTPKIFDEEMVKLDEMTYEWTHPRIVRITIFRRWWRDVWTLRMRLGQEYEFEREELYQSPGAAAEVAADKLRHLHNGLGNLIAPEPDSER